MVSFRKLTLFVAFLVTLTGAQAAGPSLSFDPATGEVISQDRAGETWYPASLTKMMTAYVVFKKLKSGVLTPDQRLPVSEIALAQPASKIGAPVGSMVPLEFAIQALLVHSANDMAYVLAEAASGTWANFVGDMNKAARELGMTASHYVNPNGLFEPRQITTARDMGLLAAALLREFPEHAHYFGQDYVKVGKRRLPSHNALLRAMPDADGMKTGFVCNSGSNVVGSATRNGRKLVVVVLGSQNGKARADLAQLLLNDGFSRSADASRPRLAELANATPGSTVPTDMTAIVCKKKPVVTLTNIHDVTGAGVSLGTYDTAIKADTALRALLLSPPGLEADTTVGVVRLPGKDGYMAAMWGMDASRSASVCDQYREMNTACEVVSPIAFAEIAATVPMPKETAARLSAQGSEVDPKKPAADWE